MREWKALGATHVTLNTAFDQFHHERIDGTATKDHLDAIRHYMEAVRSEL